MPSAMYSRIRAATCVGIADQGRAGAAAHEPDAGPEIGADLEPVAAAADAAAIIRCWPTESKRAKACCAAAIAASSTWRMRSSAAPQAASVRLAHDDVQADAEAQRAALRRRRLARCGDLLGDIAPAARPRSGRHRRGAAATSWPAPRSRRNRAADRAPARGGNSSCPPSTRMCRPSKSTVSPAACARQTVRILVRRRITLGMVRARRRRPSARPGRRRPRR